MTATQKKTKYTHEQHLEYFTYLANKKLEGTNTQLIWTSREQALDAAISYINNNGSDFDIITYALDNEATLELIAPPEDLPINKKSTEPGATKPDLKIVPNKQKNKSKVLEKFMNIDSKSLQRKRQDGDHYYFIIERGLIRNPFYMELFSVKGADSVYKHLWANLVRKGMYSDKYNLIEDYYEKGFLAYSTSIKKIAEKCFLSVNSAMNIIRVFDKLGIVKIEKAPIEKGNKEPQNIYVLGTWKMTKDLYAPFEDKPKETFYINRVFLSDEVQPMSAFNMALLIFHIGI